MDEFFLSIRRAIAARGCAAPCRRLTVVQQALIFGSDFRLIYLFIYWCSVQVCDFRILSLVVVDASKAPFKRTTCLTGEKREKKFIL